MLTIRLNKGGQAQHKQDVAASAAATPACAPHLVVSQLPVARGAGTPTSGAALNLLGYAVQRKLGDKVHFCVRCNFPIAIYGRLDACEHIFCLPCAKKDPSCFLCDEKILRVQRLELLDGVYICGAPRCLRSFLERSEFEFHVNESHKNLLQAQQQDPQQAPELACQSYSGLSPSAAAQGQVRSSIQAPQVDTQFKHGSTPPRQREERLSRQQQFKNAQQQRQLQQQQDQLQNKQRDYASQKQQKGQVQQRQSSGIPSPAYPSSYQDGQHYSGSDFQVTMQDAQDTRQASISFYAADYGNRGMPLPHFPPGPPLKRAKSSSMPDEQGFAYNSRFHNGPVASSPSQPPGFGQL